MKKIMFNDKFDLTKAVFDYRKTQTRRLVCSHGNDVIRINGKRIPFYQLSKYKESPMLSNKIFSCGRFTIGDIVAVAQRYYDIAYKLNTDFSHLPGWNNKMFVKAYLMPRHIEITNIRLDHLQNINESDCIAEGIRREIRYGQVRDYFWCSGLDNSRYISAREAYADLIDKICGKGTWSSNPLVFIYDFKLID